MRYFCAPHHWDDTKPCDRCAAARGRSPEEQLRRAIEAQVAGDANDVEELYTPSVSGSGPATAARSRAELAAEIEGRRGALAHEEVTFGRVDRRGDLVRLEWEAAALHTGALVLHGTAAVLEPTGLRLRVRAVTVARFEGARIASWRGHWEDVALAS